MKAAIILSIVSTFVGSAMAASITVPRFEMEFLLQKNYEVNGKNKLGVSV